MSKAVLPSKSSYNYMAKEMATGKILQGELKELRRKLQIKNYKQIQKF